jgi:ribosome-associated translation inhibitor RaiA
MDKDLQIIVRGIEDAGPLRLFAEKKLRRALRRFEPHLLAVTVRLEDETGPDKGGIDKVCSLDVKLRAGEVRIEERADQFEAAINSGCHRLKAVLSREVGRAKHGVGEG